MDDHRNKPTVISQKGKCGRGKRLKNTSWEKETPVERANDGKKKGAHLIRGGPQDRKERGKTPRKRKLRG